ncbi:MAG: glucosyltransferase [Oscillospiraceae bacterium]|nr:glucosyltransferase [Oscillospiraceae bacterium]
MNIAWFCPPAHGHTNPTLGTVKELTEAGHKVYYFSFEQFKEKLLRVGAEFIGCDGIYPETESKETADRIGKDKAFAVEILISTALAYDEMISEKITEIKPDIIISDSIAYWGRLTALKYNIPCITSVTTFAFNESSSKYMKQSIIEDIRMIFNLPKINKLIKQLIDKGYPVKNIMDIVRSDSNANCFVYTSEYFQPCSDSFSDSYHFIGPSIRPVETQIRKTGYKTVYISMGTVINNEEIYRNCIEALKNTEYQVIIALGNAENKFGELPDNIQIYKQVDQIAVLSIADVFITHCGMNSVSEGLYFEVPLILFPQTPEQYSVAARVSELGAGYMPDSADSKAVLNAVGKLLDNNSYKNAAANISESFKKCGGAYEARRFIEAVADTN